MKPYQWLIWLATFLLSLFIFDLDSVIGHLVLVSSCVTVCLYVYFKYDWSVWACLSIVFWVVLAWGHVQRIDHRLDQGHHLEQLCKEKLDHSLIVEGMVRDVQTSHRGSLVLLEIKKIIVIDRQQEIELNRSLALVSSYDPLSLTYGDHWTVQAELKRPWAQNPTGFVRYQRQLRLQNIDLQLQLQTSLQYTPVNERCFSSYLWTVRNFFEQRLARYTSILGYDGVQVLKAMTLGVRRGLSYPLKEQFKSSGTYHLFAISGLHVMILYVFLMYLCMFLRTPPLWGTILIMLLMASYAVMTGLASSVLRATLMLVLACSMRWSGRKVNLGQVWALALMILLVYKPEQLFLPGFQLSFTAVGSIVVSQWFIRLMRWPAYPKYVIGALQTSLVMILLTLMTAPLTYLHFGTVAWIAPISNMIIVPMASFLVMGAVLLLLSDLLGLSFVVSYLIAPWLEKLLRLMFYVTDLFSR